MATQSKNATARSTPASSSAQTGFSAARNGVSLIGSDTLRAMHAAMLRCRALARESGKSAAPDEAVLVSTTFHLRARDAIVTAAPELLARLLERQPPQFIPPGATPAALLGVAAGVAMAQALRKSDALVLAFPREAIGRVEQAVLRYAGEQRLPLLLVISDAGVRSRTANGKNGGAGYARDYGFPSIAVDRNDAVAIYRVAHEASKRARAGGGPTLIECVPYRLERDRANQNEVAGSDPILHMERYLAARGLVS